MPFDFMPTQAILDPSVRDLEPRQRLERLMDSLYAGEADENWFYPVCATCALGHYKQTTDIDFYPGVGEFSISVNATESIFKCAGWIAGKLTDEVTPRDVANCIDLVLRGEIV